MKNIMKKDRILAFLLENSLGHFIRRNHSSLLVVVTTLLSLEQKTYFDSYEPNLNLATTLKTSSRTRRTNSKIQTSGPSHRMLSKIELTGRSRIIFWKQPIRANR